MFVTGDPNGYLEDEHHQSLLVVREDVYPERPTHPQEHFFGKDISFPVKSISSVLLRVSNSSWSYRTNSHLLPRLTELKSWVVSHRSVKLLRPLITDVLLTETIVFNDLGNQLSKVPRKRPIFPDTTTIPHLFLRHPLYWYLFFQWPLPLYPLTERYKTEISPG